MEKVYAVERQYRDDDSWTWKIEILKKAYSSLDSARKFCIERTTMQELSDICSYYNVDTGESFIIHELEVE